MSSSTRRALILAAFLPASSVCVPLGAQAGGEGWTYTMNVTIDSGKSDRRTSIAMRHSVTASRYRMEMVQVSGAGAANEAEGSYTIINDVDSTITSVMPSQHMVTVMSSAGIFGAGAAAMRPTMQQHMTRTAMEDLGSGGKILGYPTRHFRFSTAGTVEITMMGQTCTQRVDGTTEVWLAPDVDLLPAMRVAAKHVGGMSAVEALGDQLESGTKMPLKGAALRTISVTHYADESGRAVPVTSTMELVELRHGLLEPALFTPPPDYKVMDMREMMKQIPPGMLDSAIKSGAAKGAINLCKSGGG